MNDNRAALATVLHYAAELEGDLAPAMRTLMASRDTSLVPALHEHLARFLDEENFFGRDLMAVLLAAIAGPAALPALLRAATRDLDDDQKRLTGAIADLLRADPEAAHRTVEAFVTSDATDERRAGLRALAHLPGAPAVGLLAGALKDPDPEVRSLAVAQLVHSTGTAGAGRDESYTALVHALSSPHEDVRAAAVAFLADHGRPDAISALEPLAADPSPRIRTAVSRALGRPSAAG